jgi:hypothetical protein
MVDDDDSPYFVADEADDGDAEDATPLDADQADDLVAEVEQFLRDHPGGNRT